MNCVSDVRLRTQCRMKQVFHVDKAYFRVYLNVREDDTAVCCGEHQLPILDVPHVLRERNACGDDRRPNLFGQSSQKQEPNTE